MIGFSFELMLLTYFMIESNAFLAPIPTVMNRSPTITNLQGLPSLNSFAVADGLSAATYINKPEISGALSTLRSFFLVLTAAVFGVTALAYLTAAFLVPKAAEQLEQDTKKLRPGLWEEYEAKLNEGEQMVNRPDLLQELGNIMQPIIMEQYEKEAANKFGDTKRDGN
ncbi:hypothetical protein HJC23_003963 [Cyclotella cryptica]|uniref:Uncharacterized protein n=1 Tax=Cyclotella cryptica TaxID=29204 RepID=A0ABD3QXC9_9STRA|eukprot:CCRYP_001937-RA/>CCRYP_001937-RA protein AED:0.21 eAED:0.21 QI:0/-1/0/1/-1/1/1/0/167